VIFTMESLSEAGINEPGADARRWPR